MARKPFSIRKFKGLDNRRAGESLITLERNEAEAYGTAAINVDIDDEFGVTRREGWSLASAGECHSLWTTPDKSLTFVVKDGQVGLLDTALNFTALLPASEAFFSYADTGAGIYFSDNVVMASYVDGLITVLAGAGSYAPDSTVVDPAEDGVIYDLPPVGSLVVYMFGRLWVVTEAGAYYSRGYMPNRFDLTTDYIDMPAITMLAPAGASGYYLGTDEQVFFIAGGNPKQPTPTEQVCDFGVFPRSAATLHSSQFGLEAKGDVVVWESPRGKVLGDNRGNVTLLTDEHVAYPATASYAATLLREVNGKAHHIAALAQPSTDGSNLRTTDVAIAEVVRNGILI